MHCHMLLNIGQKHRLGSAGVMFMMVLVGMRLLSAEKDAISPKPIGHWCMIRVKDNPPSGCTVLSCTAIGLTWPTCIGTHTFKSTKLDVSLAPCDGSLFRS